MIIQLKSNGNRQQPIKDVSKVSKIVFYWLSKNRQLSKTLRKQKKGKKNKKDKQKKKKKRKKLTLSQIFGRRFLGVIDKGKKKIIKNFLFFLKQRNTLRTIKAFNQN